MKLLFFGSGAFGLPTLESLAQSGQICGIVTQPDRPAGRGSKTAPTPIGAWAAEHLADAPLLKPQNVNDPQIISQIRSLGADAWVVIAFGQKLSRELLGDTFAINLHASLLPRWRGAAPINHAILAGDANSGNSVITLADRMDAGLVLAQLPRPIEPEQTAGQLHDLLAQDGAELVAQVLEDHEAGTLKPKEQEESLVTIASKLAKADGWVDFTAESTACRRRIHGLTPWPGVTVQHGSTTPKPLKLLNAEALEPDSAQSQSPPGTIIDADQGIIACAEGSCLKLITVQPAGKKPMPWADYARGRHIQSGEMLVGGKAT